MAGDTGRSGDPPRILKARQRTVNAVFQRAGEKITIYREIDTGVYDQYGKEETTRITVGDELAVMWYPGSGQGGARPTRKEERYGERMHWEPNIILQGDSAVQEKDIIEYGIPRHPENDGGNEQLWELETLVPYHTHIEASLQRFIEQG